MARTIPGTTLRELRWPRPVLTAADGLPPDFNSLRNDPKLATHAMAIAHQQ
jgi:hypothetical protein